MWPGYCSVHQSFGELSKVNGKMIHRMGMFLKVVSGLSFDCFKTTQFPNF